MTKRRKRLTAGQLRRRRRREKRRAERRAAALAAWKKLLNEVFGPKIVLTTRANPAPVRVRATRRPMVLHQVHTRTGEPMVTEQYRATFAGDGRRTEVEFELDPDSDKEIRAACYEAAELQHGPTARGWYLIKYEGINALGKEMVK